MIEPPRYQNLYELNMKRKAEESQKLNKLISDYKSENERCTHKIQELKTKLENQKYRYVLEREPGHYQPRAPRHDSQQAYYQNLRGNSFKGGIPTFKKYN